MWSGEDFNENGEAVRLYQPILYGKKPSQKDPTCSFIGGSSSNSILCSICRDPLHLLVQLYIPGSSSNNNRTLQIFCCNRATCTDALFVPKEKGKLVDGSGVVVCKRFVTDESQVTIKKESAKMDEWDALEDNDWTVTEGGDEMQSLEAKLAEMETNQAKPKAVVVSEKVTENKTEGNLPVTSSNSFPCFSIHSQQEPPAMRAIEDEDDVGMTGSDDKIQKMLEKYMMEEDDEEILTALRGSTGSSNGAGGGGRGEKDERLSAADRALLTFSDRLKRSPRQVLRYAYDGVPLWSIPVESPSEEKRNIKQRAKAKKKTATQITVEPSIPPCPCGAPRLFEVQVLPSILHVLEVDKASPGGDLGSLYNNGMNWGNICIYSCPKSCNLSDSEYVVVQESVDEKPAEHRQALQDVVIQEDSKFMDDEDDEDENEDCDESDDEMDEDEVQCL